MFNFVVDGFSYKPKSSTIGKREAMKGSTFWFHWNFTLNPSSESLKSYDCGYRDAAKNMFILLASQTRSSGFALAPTLPPEYIGRVKVYPSNFTFAVERLKFSDQRDYSCKLIFISTTDTGSNFDQVIPFGAANLEVQGKSFYCECLCNNNVFATLFNNKRCLNEIWLTFNGLRTDGIIQSNLRISFK